MSANKMLVSPQHHHLSPRIEMDTFIEFVKSDIGVTLAWVCTVGSTLFAVVASKKNKQLKIEIGEIKNNSTVDNSQDSVMQNGQKNLYIKSNSGGMKIDM
ncbi:hypothetical protein ACSL9F_003512 [Vibrio cholerae]